MRELAGAEITERALIAQRAQHQATERGRAARRRARERTGATGCASTAARCSRFAHLRRDVRDLRRQPSGGLHRQRRADRGQQGRAARASSRWRRRWSCSPSGIDLSVGMVLVLANCLASCIVVGSPGETALGVVGVLARRRCCAARSTALIVIFGRLQPIVTTIATGAIYFGVALRLRPRARRRSVNADARRRADGPAARRHPGEPRRCCSRVVLIVWVPFRRSVLGRAAYAVGSSEVGGLHVGRADPPRQVRRLHACRACSRRSAGCSSPSSPIRARRPPRTAAPTRCTRSPRSCSAACRCSAARAAPSARSSARSMFRTIGDLLFVFDVEPLWQPLFQGVVLLARRQPRRVRGCCASATGWSCIG